jgi:hypothetical protein
MALRIINDILPLFRDSDVETMRGFGLDLSSYECSEDLRRLGRREHAVRRALAEGLGRAVQKLDG